MPTEYSNYVESRDSVADADVNGNELLAASKGGEAVQLSAQQIANRSSGENIQIGGISSAIWLFDTVTSTIPADGDIRFDNATPASVTNIYISEITAFTQDVGNFIGTLRVGDSVYVQQRGSPTKWIRAVIRSTTTDHGGWWTIPVTVVESDTLIDNNAQTHVRFTHMGTTGATLSDFVVLVDAAPVVVDCGTLPEPKFYLETATSRTLDLQNVRGTSVLNAYSVITFIIKKTTASDVVVTLDVGFINKDIITDSNVTNYTLVGIINSYHKLTALVLGQASGALIWWNHIVQNAGLVLTEGSIYIGDGSDVASEKPLGVEFDYSGSDLILAALGITGGKIAAGAITFAKMLGAIGSGERFYVHDNAGAVTAPYGAADGRITDSTVITNLTTESGWSNDTKSVSNTLEGQRYHGTGSTGVHYIYLCKIDGTMIRAVAGEGVDIASIQFPATTTVSGTTQTIVSNNRYIPNNAALCTLTLPATSVVGDRVLVTGRGAGGWRVAQLASQIIHGTTDSTTGTGGRLDSTARYDSIELVCVVANLEWVIQSVKGTVTIT